VKFFTFLFCMQGLASVPGATGILFKVCCIIIIK
jgi:hypothetical protein